jgi:hypothetical protein
MMNRSSERRERKMIQFQSSDFASLLLLLVANVRKEKKEGE